MKVVTVLYTDEAGEYKEVVMLRSDMLDAQKALELIRKKIPDNHYIGSIIESLDHFMDRDLTELEERTIVVH